MTDECVACGEVKRVYKKVQSSDKTKVYSTCSRVCHKVYTDHVLMMNDIQSANDKLEACWNRRQLSKK